MTSLLIWFLVIIIFINVIGIVYESNDFSTEDKLWALMTLEVKLADYWISQFRKFEEQWQSVLLQMLIL